MIQGLPQKLKEMRNTYRLSQKQVAERLGVSPSIVTAYETGERTPTTEALLALSYLYKCSTDYLLGRKTPETSYSLDISGLSEEQIQAIRLLIGTIREE